MAPRLLLVLSMLGAGTRPEPLASQVPAAEPEVFLVELPLRHVADTSCRIAEFTGAPSPTGDQAQRLLDALFGREARPPAAGKSYDWIVYFPAGPGGSAGETPAAWVFDPDGRRFVEGEKLYEADGLRLVVLLAQAAPAVAYTVRAGTVVRKEQSLLSRGFPSFLSELLAGLIPRRDAPACPEPFRQYDVAVHVTQIGDPDATLLARLEVDASPVVDGGRSTALLAGFQRHRVEIETRYLGYTALGKVFDSVQAVVDSASCRDVSADLCLEAARAAAVAAVAGMDLSAEHTISAIRNGTHQALAVLEQLLAERRYEIARTFRVVERPLIGFSVGGILAEGSGEKLKFKVEDNRIVAGGVEGEGFKTLALVDLYFRRVDIGENAPGFVPHASVGFTIGEVFRPGLFLGTTLPFTAGRLAVFGGAILRKETTTDLPVNSEVEAGSRPIRERYRFPLVGGLKVGLPF